MEYHAGTGRLRQVLADGLFRLQRFAAVTMEPICFIRFNMHSVMLPLPVERTAEATFLSLLYLPRQRLPLILPIPLLKYGVRYSSAGAVVKFCSELPVSSVPGLMKGMSRISRFTLYAAI